MDLIFWKFIDGMCELFFFSLFEFWIAYKLIKKISKRKLNRFSKYSAFLLTWFTASLIPLSYSVFGEDYFKTAPQILNLASFPIGITIILFIISLQKNSTSDIKIEALTQAPRADKTNRHVPLIFGIVSLALAVYLLFSVISLWKFLFVVPLLMFGWASFKTALFASDDEIQELTGRSPASEETLQKLEDRF